MIGLNLSISLGASLGGVPVELPTISGASGSPNAVPGDTLTGSPTGGDWYADDVLIDAGVDGDDLYVFQEQAGKSITYRVAAVDSAPLEVDSFPYTDVAVTYVDDASSAGTVTQLTFDLGAVSGTKTYHVSLYVGVDTFNGPATLDGETPTDVWGPEDGAGYDNVKHMIYTFDVGAGGNKVLSWGTTGTEYRCAACIHEISNFEPTGTLQLETVNLTSIDVTTLPGSALITTGMGNQTFPLDAGDTLIPALNTPVVNTGDLEGGFFYTVYEDSTYTSEDTKTLQITNPALENPIRQNIVATLLTGTWTGAPSLVASPQAGMDRLEISTGAYSDHFDPTLDFAGTLNAEWILESNDAAINAMCSINSSTGSISVDTDAVGADLLNYETFNVRCRNPFGDAVQSYTMVVHDGRIGNEYLTTDGNTDPIYLSIDDNTVTLQTIVASQAVTSATGLATGLNGSVGGDFDTLRFLRSRWTGAETATVTIHGEDELANVITAVVAVTNGNDAITDKKFYKVTDVTTSADITGFELGWGPTELPALFEPVSYHPGGFFVVADVIFTSDTLAGGTLYSVYSSSNTYIRVAANGNLTYRTASGTYSTSYGADVFTSSVVPGDVYTIVMHWHDDDGGSLKTNSWLLDKDGATVESYLDQFCEKGSGSKLSGLGAHAAWTNRRIGLTNHINGSGFGDIVGTLKVCEGDPATFVADVNANGTFLQDYDFDADGDVVAVHIDENFSRDPATGVVTPVIGDFNRADYTLGSSDWVVYTNPDPALQVRKEDPMLSPLITFYTDDGLSDEPKVEKGVIGDKDFTTDFGGAYDTLTVGGVDATGDVDASGYIGGSKTGEILGTVTYNESSFNISGYRYPEIAVITNSPYADLCNGWAALCMIPAYVSPGAGTSYADAPALQTAIDAWAVEPVTADLIVADQDMLGTGNIEMPSIDYSGYGLRTATADGVSVDKIDVNAADNLVIAGFRADRLDGGNCDGVLFEDCATGQFNLSGANGQGTNRIDKCRPIRDANGETRQWNLKRYKRLEVFRTICGFTNDSDCFRTTSNDSGSGETSEWVLHRTLIYNNMENGSSAHPDLWQNYSGLASVTAFKCAFIDVKGTYGEVDKIVQSQALTSATGLATGVNGDFATKFDTPRPVQGFWTGSATITVHGEDFEGTVITEDLSTTNQTGLLEFFKVTDVTTDADVTAFTLGTVWTEDDSDAICLAQDITVASGLADGINGVYATNVDSPRRLTASWSGDAATVTITGEDFDGNVVESTITKSGNYTPVDQSEWFYKVTDVSIDGDRTNFKLGTADQRAKGAQGMFIGDCQTKNCHVEQCIMDQSINNKAITWNGSQLNNVVTNTTLKGVLDQGSPYGARVGSMSVDNLIVDESTPIWGADTTSPSGVIHNYNGDPTNEMSSYLSTKLEWANYTPDTVGAGAYDLIDDLEVATA